jgi:hypothetical protein
MRKTLLPMFVSLALCGAAATALAVSSAHAQPEARNPVMVPPVQVAQNDPMPDGAPQRDLRRRNPADFAARMKQMCQERYARATGELTYLQTRLELTASQQPAFQRWSQAKLGIAKRHADDCAQRPLPNRNRADRGQLPGPGDMMGREEERLKQRLSDIQTERPALEALYNTLSPQQRVELIRAGRHDRPGPRRFADARGHRGPMGGRMDRHGPGPDAPPPQER